MYSQACRTTRWHPAQFRQVRRSASNITQIDSSCVSMTWSTYWVTVLFRPRPRHPVAVLNRSEHYALSGYLVDICSNPSSCQILPPAMLIVWKIGPASLGGCTNDWYNCCPGRKPISHCALLITGVHLTVSAATLRVWKAHQINFKVRLKCEMCQKELDIFETFLIV